MLRRLSHRYTAVAPASINLCPIPAPAACNDANLSEPLLHERVDQASERLTHCEASIQPTSTAREPDQLAPAAAAKEEQPPTAEAEAAFLCKTGCSSVPVADTLSLAVKGLGDEDCAVLARMLEGSAAARLRRLDLSLNRIGSAGAISLRPLLCGAGRLETLALSENRIADEGAVALGAALRDGGCGALRRLLLGWNRIGDEGMAALAASFGAGGAPKLLELRLEGNLLGDASAEALAAALCERDNSQRLGVLCFGNEIGGNVVGDRGLMALIEVFDRLSDVQELLLSNNRIGPASTIALANAICLGGGARLQKLHLHCNQIEAEGEAALCGVRACRAAIEVAWLPCIKPAASRCVSV